MSVTTDSTVQTKDLTADTQSGGADVRTIDLGIDGLSGAVHLGSGGSANVFAARVLDTGERVAVKLLRASADSEKERTRFTREQETLRTLAAQDGIVPVLDAGLTDREEPYFLMPLMEGSLQDRIDDEGALDWQTATQLMAEVADTVEFAHSQKVLHRDLKPGNILLDDEGVPRVADFGIAKLVDSSVSKSSKALGTPSFMPPERFNGHDATSSSDVYGLAATLSALITGSAPFLTGENDTDAAVMMRVVTEAPPTLAGHDVPDELRDAVQRGMAKDPAERPQTASEFASILRMAIDPYADPALNGPVTIAIPRRNITIPDAPVASTKGSTIEVGDDPSDEDGKRKGLLLLAAALFALILGAGAVLALNRNDSPDVEVASETEVADAAEGGTDGAEDGDAADGDGELEGDAAAEGSLVGDSGEGGDAADGDGELEGDAADEDDEPVEGSLGFETELTSVDNGTETVTTTDTGGNTNENGGTDNAGTVTDNTTIDGGGETEGGGDNTEVVVEPDPADACFSGSASSVEVGQSVQFTNCSKDATSYSWTFGDGTTSALQNPSKSWASAGTKTVRLTARGPGGNDTYSRTITVTAVPDPAPEACFNPSATTITAGQSISFANCSSHADSYWWEFGDGDTSSLASPSHTYSNAGTYEVRLRATGAGGNDWATRNITVNAAPVATIDAETRWVTLAPDDDYTSSNLLINGATNARWLTDSSGGTFGPGHHALSWEGSFSHSRQSDSAYSFWVEYELVNSAGQAGASARINVNVEAKAPTGPEDRSRTLTMSAAQNQINVNLLGAGGNSARWLGGDDKHALYGTGQYIYDREDPGASTHTFQFYELLNQVIIVRWTVTVNVEAQT